MIINVHGKEVYDLAEQATTKACKDLKDYNSITHNEVDFVDNKAIVTLSVLYNNGERKKVVEVISI